MLTISLDGKASTAATAASIIVAAILLGGCYPREQLPYHAIHNPVDGKPRSFFVDPIGVSYPTINNLRQPSSYRPLPEPPRPGMLNPLPTPSSRPKSLPNVGPKASLPVPNAAPVVERQPPLKQTLLRPARERFVAVKPVPGDVAPATPTATAPLDTGAVKLPTVEVVPSINNTVEGRATTEMRR